MINELYEKITAGLSSVKECTVYREEVPQDFTGPGFGITLNDQRFSRGINKRLKHSVRFDVLYYPEDKAAPQKECWDMGQKLQRKFRLDGFKLKNRTLKITDKVLHFQFDVEYQEYLPDDIPAMQSLSQNTELKE